MKQIRTSEDEQLHQIPIPALRQTIKKPLIIPTVRNFYTKHQTLDAVKLLVKYPRFFRMDFRKTDYTFYGEKKIIQRNLKYLKKTKYFKFKSTPSFLAWRLIDQWENVLLEEYWALGSAIGPHIALNIAAHQPQTFLKNIVKHNLAPKALNLRFNSLEDPRQRRKYGKQLESVETVRVSNLFNTCEELFFFYQDEEEGLQNIERLKNLYSFTNLKSLSVELIFKGCKTEHLYKILETASDISSLRSLKIKMEIYEIDQKGQNLKKLLAKFAQLNYLHLELRFDKSLKSSGKMFSSLSQFKSLKHLKIEIFTEMSFDHFPILKFVSAHKKLETLKFKTTNMRFDEYNELFEGIKKIKSLNSLCLTEREKYQNTFGYGSVFKILEVLKNLKSFTLKLGWNAFDAVEMLAIFKHLVRHPSLEKVDLSMKMHSHPMKPYNFDDDFYCNIAKLKEKLLSFKVLFNISAEFKRDPFYENVSKIICPDWKENRYFACRKEICFNNYL